MRRRLCSWPAGPEQVLPEALRRPVAAALLAEVGKHAAAQESKASPCSSTCVTGPMLPLTLFLLVSVVQDPFPGVSELYKQALGEEEHMLLTAFFTKNSTESFLLEMHEFLVLVLKNPNAENTFKPDWG